MSDYEIALITGGMGIAGTLAGAVVAYRLTLAVADKQFKHLQAISKLDAWHVAAREFIQAFTTELAVLDSGSNQTGSTMDFLRASYAVHSKAVVTFERYIPEPRQHAFRIKWKHHCYGEPDVDWPRHETESSMDHDDLLYLHYERAPTTSAASRISDLLAFAKDA